MKRSGNPPKQIQEIFNPEPYLVSGITKAEVLELKDAFDLLDSSGTGKLDPSGFPLDIQN